MNLEPVRDSVDPALDPALESALRGLPRPQARSAFKSELGRSFLAGADQSLDPAFRDVLPEDERRPRAQRGPRTFVYALLAVAAAIVAILVLRPSKTRWEVLDGSTGGIVRIDARSVSGAEREKLAQSLVDARELVAEGGVLRLRFGDAYLLELAQGTRVMFTALDPQGASDPLGMRVDAGAVRVVTGPGLPATHMRLVTSQADMLVTGTAFAVEAQTSGTCLCCMHGSVALKRLGSKEAARSVESGKMCYLFAGTEPAKWGDAMPPHVEPVHALDLVAQRIWPR